MTETPTSATEPGNEVAVNGGDDEGTLEVFPPAKVPSMSALGTLGEHVDNMRKAVYFAEGMCYTQMVPARFQGKPKDAAAAVLFGAEVGLSPIASLRSVIVIHGMPGFEARTMKAILKGHGYRFRTIEKSATRAEIWAWEPDSPVVIDDNPDSPHYGRRINPDDEAVWTIDDAVQAGFVPRLKPNAKNDNDFETNSNGKLKGNMKYLETPKIMLEAKVTAEVCRSIAPHILLGLPYSSEEIETEIRPGDDDDDDDRPARTATPTRARGAEGLRGRAKKAKEKPAPEVVDAEEVAVPVPADGAEDVTPAAPEPASVVPDQPAADPSPAPPEADTTPDDDIADAVNAPDLDLAVDAAEDAAAEPERGTPHPNTAPEPPAPAPATEAAPDAAPADDLEMSPSVRSKGVDMLNGLLINGSVVADDVRADALSEVAAKRPGAVYRRINTVDELTNTELKFMVDTLRAWKAKGQLESWLAEGINNAGLREAGLLDAEPPADEAQA